MDRILKCMIINHRSGMYTFWHESIDALCIASSFIYMHFAAQRHDDNYLEKYMFWVEIVFLVDCLLSFIKDYDDPMDPKGPSIRNISKIFTNYTITSNAFVYDAIALMPITLIKMTHSR